MKKEKKYSYQALLRETLPTTAITIHSILMFLGLVIGLPLLFSDKFEGQEHVIKYPLLLYSLFYFIIWVKLLVGLWLWNKNRNSFAKKYELHDLVFHDNCGISFNKKDKTISGGLNSLAIGKTPKQTRLIFDKCDIIELNNSLIIFGKGHTGFLGKGIAKPFEISFNHFPFTNYNSAKIISCQLNTSTCFFQLKAIGPFNEFDFDMTVQGLTLKTVGNKA